MDKYSMNTKHSRYKKRFISAVEDSLKTFSIKQVRLIYIQYVSIHGTISCTEVNQNTHPRFYAFLLIRDKV